MARLRCRSAPSSPSLPCAAAVQRVARSAAADTRRMLEETERVLKRLSAHAAVKTLSILSMFSTLEHVQQALNAGASGYLLKESAGVELKEAIESLSRRERQILQLVVEGKSSSEIGQTLHLSAKTVETYRSRMMQKLGVDGVTARVKFAVANGITPAA